MLEEGQQSVALDLNHCWVDVVEFMRLATNGTTDDLASLQRAEELYRDDFLAGFNLSLSYEFETWALAEQTRLKEEMTAPPRLDSREAAQFAQLQEMIVQWQMVLSTAVMNVAAKVPHLLDLQRYQEQSPQHRFFPRL